MTLQERLDDVHRHSVSLYLQRQGVEVERQRLAQMANQIDQKLIGYDAQIAILEEMIKSEAN